MRETSLQACYWNTAFAPRLARRLLWAAVLCLWLGAGQAAAETADPVDRDPFESWNRPMHNFNETLDKNVLQPVARGYQKITPRPVERSVANFFSNLTLPLSIVGSLLQLDAEKAVKETGRFVINSTVGFAGLFDPAGPLGLPPQEEDLGQALEYWGVKNSPYLVLPFVGPMTLVQIPDRILGPLSQPYITQDIWHPALYGLEIVSLRTELLAASALLDESAADSYIFTREAYLQRRRHLLYDGEPPLDDLFDDDF